MKKKHSTKRNSNRKKVSVFDKVVFIVSGLSTLTFFLVDIFSKVWNFDLPSQICLCLVATLSAFFTIISFNFDKKFRNLEKKIGESDIFINNLHTATSDKLQRELGQSLSSLHDLYTYKTSENEDFKEYAQKKVDRLIHSLNCSLNAGESEVLDETDYYDKLNQLADKIEKDQLQYNRLDEIERDGRTKPIIWALTCFNEDEWGEEIKNEDAWSDRLEKLTADYGVAVERICILSDCLQNFIKIEDVNEIKKALDNSKHLNSFIGFLRRYYKADVRERYKMSTHYAFFANKSSKLAKTKGFFGICLSNEEKHIVKGDCVAETNKSTAIIVFNCEDLHNEFTVKKGHSKRLEKYIDSTASVAFKEFLKSEMIDIS